jgi:L-alanine-DL-glutamate epimerase-like enolase superfamily enzyme
LRSNSVRLGKGKNIVKITSVRGYPISRRVRPEFAIVSAAGSHPISNFVIVEITTDAAIAGFGEASVVPVWSGESQASAMHAIADILGPVLIGQDPLAISGLTDAMDRVLIGNPFTKAGVEMALLDLAAKSIGVPACVLAGGARRPREIPLKFSIGAFPPAEAAIVARQAVELGFRAVKVKVGINTPADIARVQAVRSELGQDFPIAVDANAGWTVSEASIAIPQLERLGVMALEQPIARRDFHGCAFLRQRTCMPLMLDESVFTAQDALEAIRLEACDLISIYPGKNGGILRSLAIAQLVAAAGLRCVIGSNLEMNLGTAAMLTLAVTTPALATSIAHDIIGPVYYKDQGLQIEYREGCAVLPEGKGLGVTPDQFIPENG